jgi:hypothetical protein
MIDLPDFSEIEKALQKLADPKWLASVDTLGIEVLHRDMVERLDRIKTETPFAKVSLTSAFGAPEVQGANFGRDTGRFQDGWLNSLSFANGEFVFSSDVDYAAVQQELAEAKSPFTEGYLGVSEAGLDMLEEAIAKTAGNFYAN